MTSMSESALKGPELKGCDAENQTHRGVVSVEGYDTSLQPYYLKLLLKKYFSPCGKITDILVSREMETGLLKSSASIFFDGEGAEDKALNLSGNYVGGWKLVVAHENYSDYMDDIEAEAVAVAKAEGEGEGEGESGEEEEEEIDDNEFEFVDYGNGDDEEEEKEKDKERRMLVSGFDMSASKLDIKINMCEHFYSCGEVMSISVDGYRQTNAIEGYAIVHIRGKGATDRAQKLSAGPWNFNVVIVFPTQAQRMRRNHEFFSHLSGKCIHHCS